MRNTINNRIIVNGYNPIPLGFAKQLDDITLKLDLYDKNGTSFDVAGQTISLGCKRPDNVTEELSNTSTDTPITVNKNRVTIVLKNSMVSVNGKTNFELNMSDTNGAMTSASFFIMVASVELDDTSVESSNQYSTLRELIKNYENLSSTDTTAEVVAARGTYNNLNDRLAGVDNLILKKPYYFNTVAEMKNSLLLTAGSCAITLGYYEAGDGGGANYIISGTPSTVDNGSVIALSNGKYAKLVLDETFNLKQFGAKGDDLTDDTMSLYNCIQFIKSMPVRKTLKIPNGVYKVNTDVLDDKGFKIDRINIQGEMCGMMQPYNISKVIGSVIHDVSVTSTKPLFYIGDPSNRTWGGFFVSDLLVTGERQSRDAFFSYRHGWESFMTRVGIDNFGGSGLVLDSSYDGSYRDITITRCGGATIDSSVRYSFHTLHASDITNACKFYNLHIEDSPYMVYLNGLRHCNFVGCKFEMGLWSVNSSSKFENYNLSQSPIVGGGLMEIEFDDCMFVPWGLPQYRTNTITTTADNQIPYFINFKNGNVDKYLTSSVKFNNCDFTTNSKGAAKVFKNDNTTCCQFNNCIFDTVSGEVIYPIMLYGKSSTMTNSRIVIKNIEGSLRALYVSEATVSNLTVEEDKTVNDSLKELTSEQYIVGYCDGALLENVNVLCGKYKIGKIGTMGYIKRRPKIVTVNEDLIGTPADYNDVTLDLSVIDADVIKLSLKQNATITAITQGGLGEKITIFINDNTNTYTFKYDSAKSNNSIKPSNSSGIITVKGNDIISFVHFDHLWRDMCFSIKTT